MNKFRTEICVKPSDVEMILSWHDEKEYWLGRAFLAKIDDYPESLRQTDPNHLEWYYLDEAQYQALLDFRKRLRERRAGRSDADGNSR
jgi:hypothetical protein